MSAARKVHKLMPKRSQLLGMLLRLKAEMAAKQPATYAELQRLLVKKASKSQSGVLVITVLTSPYPTVNGKTQKFSCAWNCYYCPNEPAQPRSYLHDEPAVKRANENGFDAVLQFTDRAATLAMNGHPVDKIELLVLGGTWASYPLAYQEEFIRDLIESTTHHPLRGSFSAVSTPIVRRNGAFFSIFQNLQEFTLLS